MSEMPGADDQQYQVSPYRWKVLFFFIIASTMTQVVWITYAPITIQAAAILTQGNTFWIVFLSMVYMIFYLPMNFPANWALEKFGLKWGAGIGVLAMGIFGFIRGLTLNYGVILFCQIATALGQPFVLNAYTKLAINWFPEKEKTLASGLSTMSLMLGVIFAMTFSGPFFALFGLFSLGLFYGLLCLGAMLMFFLFVKDKPPSPPSPAAEKPPAKINRSPWALFRNRDFAYYSIIILIGYGAVNAILSEVDLIIAPPRVLDINNPNAAGIIGDMIVLGGMAGSVILSALSDRLHKRKPFLIVATVGGFPLTLLIALLPSFNWLCLDAFIFGFTLFGGLPVGLTYAAEITWPVPEEVSNGMIMWVAQIGGIIFLFYFNLTVISVFLLVALVLVFLMHDVDFAKRKEIENPPPLANEDEVGALPPQKANDDEDGTFPPHQPNDEA
jgi:FLVCR family feline leukemia virus subgroup C receptor-related protein